MSSLPKPLGQPWERDLYLGTYCILRQYRYAAMRVNPTVVLTLILLSLMFGAGLTSAIYGYKLGRGALKGITQPDARPVNNLADADGQPIRRDGLTFLKESEILSSVKARIEGNADASAEAASDAPAPSAAPASAQ
jgi:hypothetical protein